jgi:hypothetical protein
MADALGSQWVILSDDNIAIRFERHDLHIDFWLFNAALTTRHQDGEVVSEGWELEDCGDSWPLDRWDDAFWEIRGSIKWDGCINWESNPECMVHGCGPSHITQLTTQFSAIYAFAKRHFDLLGEATPAMPEPILELAA